jgi:rod shape-determining protein MreD
MIRLVLINILRFVFLVFLQVFVLNKINIIGYVNPYVYVAFILLLPIQTPKWLLLVAALALGFCIDIFMHTIGINMAATLFIAWMRPGVISLILGKKEIDIETNPGIVTFGFKSFLVYSTILVFSHHLVFFFLEAFKFSQLFSFLGKIMMSGLFSVTIIMLGQLFWHPRKTS